MLLTLLPTPAAAQAGLRPAQWIIDETSQEGRIQTRVRAMVWYPTTTASTPQSVGPFRFQAALGAPPAPGRHSVVMLSHGTGGSELGHAWLGEALAAAGYIVVAPRHPQDNHEDRSGPFKPGYFERRAQQLSSVLSAVLGDAAWGPLIDADRVAAVGHSAGGYTVLALAGGQPDPARILRHCAPGSPSAQDDALMCSLGGTASLRLAAVAESQAAVAAGRSEASSVPADLRDPRIRTVIAIAPLGVVFSPESLAAIPIPVHIEAPLRDAVLAPRWHALALCAAIPKARCEADDAGHFASFQAGTGPLPSDAGDPAADPPGFDRLAWQRLAVARVLSTLDPLRRPRPAP